MNFFSRPSRIYLIEYQQGGSADQPFQHRFCGPHDVPRATCPNCRKPLLRMLALDTSDARLEFGACSYKSLGLFFCWTCNLAQDEFCYEVKPDGGINVVHYGHGGARTDFPYEDYPLFFPAQVVQLREPSSEEEEIIAALSGGALSEWQVPDKFAALGKPRHQVGGDPYLLGNEREMRCPSCGRAMPFLASVGDDTGTPRGFTENPYVQVMFHMCRSCHVIAAYQETD